MGKIEKSLAVLLACPATLVVGYFTVWESVAWAWFLGAACVAVFVYAPQVGWRQVIIPLMAVMAGILWRFQKLSLASQVNIYDLQLLIFSGVGLMLVVLATKDLRIPSLVRWAAEKGAYVSYALYLTHEPIRVLVAQYVNSARVSGAWLSVLVCVVFATVCAWLLEDKHVNLRVWLKGKLINPKIEPVRTQATKPT